MNAPCSPNPLLRASLFLFGFLTLLAVAPSAASAQACPAGRACFYVPPALPTPPGYTIGWDMALSSPRGTITGTWRAGGGAPTAFSVSPGSPLIVPLSATEGTASGFDVAESRGVFIEASSGELLVAHRVSEGPWQSSATIKSSAFGLGRRFRLGGYVLNGSRSPDTGYDYVSVYAPFGGTVTFNPPNGAALGYWEGHPTETSFSVTLAAGQTYTVRTVPAPLCGREIDGALVTSTEPISVDTGGRGWDAVCSVSGSCGDDGADNVLPTSGIGTEYVLLDFPPVPSNGEHAKVIADVDRTEVRVNGTLVATLSAGEAHTIATISGPTHVETSQPAYVYQNSGLSRCELDLSLIPQVALAPVGAWTTDFNVPAGFTGEVGIVIAASQVSSLRLDGGAAPPTFTSDTAVPGRADLHAVHFTVGAGNHSVTADADFQLGLVTSNGGTGLFGYYTPYRLPGCGDGSKAATEGCDDGNLVDGDGCSSTCKLEVGATGCVDTSECVPAARCDAGTCVARCFTNAECNDTNDCTVDSCDGSGACVNAPVAAGDPGTCGGGQVCSGAPSNRCVDCVTDAECGGATPLCDASAGTCVACLTGGDCDDGDDCTADACAAGACTNTAVAAGDPGTCPAGTLCAGTPLACTAECGDGLLAAGEACDDGNLMAMDGCDASCSVEAGWSCSCAAPTFTYSMETSAGSVGGDGGSVGPQMGCTGNDVLIGLAIQWSDGRREGVRTKAICGSVSVDATGAVTTTPTTTQTDGGSGCGGWDPATWSPDVTCPTGWAVVGISGSPSMLGAMTTLFTTMNIVCQPMGVDGRPAGPTMTLAITGGGDPGATIQTATCPPGTIARFFQTRRGCGQDALDLFCGVPAVSCDGSGSICAAQCGDGVIGAPAETCDDGNAEAGDGCDATCQVESGWDCATEGAPCTAICGDSIVVGGEECDEGGDGPTCDADCTAAACGDGTLNTAAGEECDDGAANSDADPDTCRTTCANPSCGDGVVDTGEGCDEGALNSDEPGATCRTNCALASCGDGVVDDGEECDDGAANADAADACRTTCVSPACGDGIVDTGEACDDGTSNSDTAPDACRRTCAVASCGDGVVDTGEECDDGPSGSATCDPSCRTVVAMDAGVDAGGMGDAGVPDAGVDAGSDFGLAGGALCSAPAAPGAGRFPPLFGLAVAWLLWRRRRR